MKCNHDLLPVKGKRTFIGADVATLSGACVEQRSIARVSEWFINLENSMSGWWEVISKFQIIPPKPIGQTITFASALLVIVIGLGSTPPAGAAQNSDLENARSGVHSKINDLTDAQATTFAHVTQKLTDCKDALNELNVGSSAIVAAGLGSGPASGTVSLPINILPGNISVAALQFDVILPTGFTLTSFSTGPVVGAAGKAISSSPVNGGTRFLVFGLNQNTIEEGLMLTLKLKVDSSVRQGNYFIAMNEPSASDPFGQVAVLATMSGTVVVR